MMVQIFIAFAHWSREGRDPYTGKKVAAAAAENCSGKRVACDLLLLTFEI
jgi:hypothetical protein